MMTSQPAHPIDIIFPASSFGLFIGLSSLTAICQTEPIIISYAMMTFIPVSTLEVSIPGEGYPTSAWFWSTNFVHENASGPVSMTTSIPRSLKYPISMGIYMFKSATSMYAHYVMAASLTAVVPVLIIFFSAQQYFIKGIVLSGIKG